MSQPQSLLVLKFGGAALATPARIRRAARRVAWHRTRGHDVVVVASAMGEATDRLLGLAEKVRDPKPLLSDREGSEVRGAGVPGSVRSPTPDLGPRTSDPRSDRERDRILATGEDLSAALLATAITAQGRHARSLRGGEAGLLASGDFGAGELLDLALSPILDLLRAQAIPVVSGFQAIRVHDGETVTLGRGTSDLTAVFLASKLRAAECHLIKDVDGVYDSDPNQFAAAQRHSTLSYEALVTIAATSQIVHAGAARLAHSSGVRLRIYGYKAPNRVTEEHCTRVGENEAGAVNGAATATVGEIETGAASGATTSAVGAAA